MHNLATVLAFFSNTANFQVTFIFKVKIGQFGNVAAWRHANFTPLNKIEQTKLFKRHGNQPTNKQTTAVIPPSCLTQSKAPHTPHKNKTNTTYKWHTARSSHVSHHVHDTWPNVAATTPTPPLSRSPFCKRPAPAVAVAVGHLAADKNRRRCRPHHSSSPTANSPVPRSSQNRRNRFRLSHCEKIQPCLLL